MYITIGWQLRAKNYRISETIYITLNFDLELASEPDYFKLNTFIPYFDTTFKFTYVCKILMWIYISVRKKISSAVIYSKLT